MSATKYRLIKELTIASIYNLDPCVGEFEKLIRFIKDNGYIDRWDHDFLWCREFESSIIDKYPTWIDWLLENKFIELNKPKLEYDVNKIYITAYGSSRLKLHMVYPAGKWHWICLNTTQEYLGSVHGFNSFEEAIKGYEVEVYNRMADVFKPKSTFDWRK